ncbi:MAG: hypothetical protein IPF92_20925 [Myxococcales bacterium]|nr:hypothetical protein [Myxococcales bacterium]
MFHGRVEAVRATRQAALDAAHEAHPERFPNGPPRVALPPAQVHINPTTAEAALVVDAPKRRDEATSSVRREEATALPRAEGSVGAVVANSGRAQAVSRQPKAPALRGAKRLDSLEHGLPNLPGGADADALRPRPQPPPPAT